MSHASAAGADTFVRTGGRIRQPPQSAGASVNSVRILGRDGSYLFMVKAVGGAGIETDPPPNGVVLRIARS